VKLGIGQTAPLMKLRSDLSENEVSFGKSSTFSENHDDVPSKVSLRNVHFKYESPSNFELKEIEFELDKGQFLAIIGPSGGGKSTLVDLLLGILEPTQGSVEIGALSPGKFVQKFPGAIGYVPQVTYITDGTIRENLTLGFRPDEIEDDSLWRALRVADLENYVKTLPDSLDTLIGNIQGQLSGGQKQRLGIARALISQPKILILDEPTSSLDSESETRISESLLRLKHDLILVVVAHRMSTIENADFVMYLENGYIKAKGNLDEVHSFIARDGMRSNFTKD
jgi:ATP-binding cassette subfamily C protein